MSVKVCGCGRTYAASDQHRRCGRCRKAGRTLGRYGAPRTCALNNCGGPISSPHGQYCDECRISRQRANIKRARVANVASFKDLSDAQIDEIIDRNHRQRRPGWTVCRPQPTEMGERTQ